MKNRYYALIYNPSTRKTGRGYEVRLYVKRGSAFVHEETLRYYDRWRECFYYLELFHSCHDLSDLAKFQTWIKKHEGDWNTWF